MCIKGLYSRFVITAALSFPGVVVAVAPYSLGFGVNISLSGYQGTTSNNTVTAAGTNTITVTKATLFSLFGNSGGVTGLNGFNGIRGNGGNVDVVVTTTGQIDNKNDKNDPAGGIPVYLRGPNSSVTNNGAINSLL